MTIIPLLPFILVLLSFALLPSVAPRLWHRRMEPLTLGLVGLAVIIAVVLHGPFAAFAGLWRATFEGFAPFIAVLMALYVLSGGILIAGGPWGRPLGNLMLLTLGTLLASVIGTIGASLLLIHPLLAANAARHEKRHLVIGFIILVGNVGGALSPLGDPPLLLGFLRGVPFFWPTQHLLLPMLGITIPVLALVYGIDRRLASREPLRAPSKLVLRGGLNGAMLVLFVAAMAVSPMLPHGQAVLTGLALVLIGISEWTSSKRIRARNRFAWTPMREIAVLFFAIFATIPPVLQAVSRVPLGRDPALWFWASGICSALLDSAPTYLMFYQAAGHDLMRLLPSFSAGSVLFGALTYLGNAPNLMIRAIASRRGVKMPGFLGYAAVASAILVPIFLIETGVFFR